MSKNDDYDQGFLHGKDSCKEELAWWKKHAEAMEGKVSLLQRGFKVEALETKEG